MRLAYALLQAASSALYLPHQTGTPSAHSGRSHSLAHSRSRPIVQSHGIGGGGGDGFGGFGGGGGGDGDDGDLGGFGGGEGDDLTVYHGGGGGDAFVTGSRAPTAGRPPRGVATGAGFAAARRFGSFRPGHVSFSELE